MKVVLILHSNCQVYLFVHLTKCILCLFPLHQIWKWLMNLILVVVFIYGLKKKKGNGMLYSIVFNMF